MPLSDDSTSRFSSRVGTYTKFRPGYPTGVVDLLAAEAHLNENSLVADVGSGTGLLASGFLDCGFRVVGVEPNPDMREAGDRQLAGYSRFHSVAATAEATTLDDHSADLIVAGQAFHWFEAADTRHEWVRILKREGVAALIWNERHPESPHMRAIEDIVDKFAAERDSTGAIREAGRSRIQPFFSPATFQLSEFPNSQDFDLPGLIGRIASSSYLPNEGEPGYSDMAEELTRIFDAWQQNGALRFEYRTKVFWGRL